MVIVTKTPHQYTRVHTSNIHEVHANTYRAAERGGGRGATCPGPQTRRGPQLEKYPEIEQGLIKIGASTRH